MSDKFVFHNEEKLEPHESTVPEGYQWCEECEALTPHELIGRQYNCVLCGDYKDEWMEGCPRCNWQPPEEWGGPILVKTHHSQCHFREDYIDRDEMISYNSWSNIILWDMRASLNQYYKYDDFLVYIKKFNTHLYMKCGCPEVTIYPNPWVLESDSGGPKYPDGDYWFWEKYRCPICGTIFEISD